MTVFSFFNRLVSQDIKVFNDSNSIIHTLDSLNTNYYYQLKGCVKFDVYLDLENLSVIEKLLIDSIETYNNKEFNIIRERQISLEEYYYNILSAECENDKHLVWVNGSCQKHPDFGKRFLGHGNDGGECYFYIIVNLTDCKVKEFKVNGF